MECLTSYFLKCKGASEGEGDGMREEDERRCVYHVPYIHIPYTYIYIYTCMRCLKKLSTELDLKEPDG